VEVRVSFSNRFLQPSFVLLLTVFLASSAIGFMEWVFHIIHIGGVVGGFIAVLFFGSGLVLAVVAVTGLLLVYRMKPASLVLDDTSKAALIVEGDSGKKHILHPTKAYVWDVLKLNLRWGWVSSAMVEFENADELQKTLDHIRGQLRVSG